MQSQTRRKSDHWDAPTNQDPRTNYMAANYGTVNQSMGSKAAAATNNLQNKRSFQNLMFMRTPYLTDYTGNIGLLNASKNSGHSGPEDSKTSRVKKVSSNMNMTSHTMGAGNSSTAKKQNLNNSGNSGPLGGGSFNYGQSDVRNTQTGSDKHMKPQMGPNQKLSTSRTKRKSTNFLKFLNTSQKPTNDRSYHGRDAHVGAFEEQKSGGRLGNSQMQPQRISPANTKKARMQQQEQQKHPIPRPVPGDYETSGDNYFTKSRQIVVANQHATNQHRVPALYKNMKNKMIALRYKTKVVVEGVGEYEIEITNIVNTKTLKEKSFVPSMLSLANVQKTEAERYRKVMVAQAKRNAQTKCLTYTTASTKREEALRMLSRLGRRHLRKNFDLLQMNSIDYQRTLLIQKEQTKQKQQRVLDRLALHLKMRGNFAKTKAFFSWKELLNTDYTLSSGGGLHRGDSIGTLFGNIGLSHIDKSTSENKLSKAQKKAIRKMDEVVLSNLSTHFTAWKLKTLLLRGSQQSRASTPAQVSNSSPSETFTDDLSEKMKMVLASSKAVKVKWIPTQEADENCSNEEQKSDSGEFGKQRFLDFTIDLETEENQGIDPSDSQFYLCNESNDSDEEAEANDVLNELNDMILNIGQEASPFEISSDAERGSIEQDDYETDLMMPQTESLLYEEGQELEEHGISKPQVQDYNVLPKFDAGTEQADGESGLRSLNNNGTLEHGLNQLVSPQQQSSGSDTPMFTFQSKKQQ